MNVILFVPYQGRTLFWNLAASSIEETRIKLAEKYGVSASNPDGAGLFDGIMEMYCHDEDNHPLLPIAEEDGDE